MTENKRFTMDLDGFFYDNHRKKNSANIYDNNTFIGSVMIGAKFIIDLLNELDEKYVDEFALRETLQQELQRVEEENKQLKQQLNYIQNSISEHIKHQKTELGQKALREIIEDYNEWLLGHKGLQE